MVVAVAAMAEVENEDVVHLRAILLSPCNLCFGESESIISRLNDTVLNYTLRPKYLLDNWVTSL